MSEPVSAAERYAADYRDHTVVALPDGGNQLWAERCDLAARVQALEAEVESWKCHFIAARWALGIIAKDEALPCRCGDEPYTDGEQCPRCFATCLVECLRELKPDQPDMSEVQALEAKLARLQRKLQRLTEQHERDTRDLDAAAHAMAHMDAGLRESLVEPLLCEVKQTALEQQAARLLTENAELQQQVRELQENMQLAGIYQQRLEIENRELRRAAQAS